MHRLMRALRIEPSEALALLWSWLYFASVLFAYYIIRPVRDEMGIAGGVEHLSWLFTATLVAMVAVNLPFAALTRRLPRLRLVALCHRFFVLNLLLIAALFFFSTPSQHVWVGRGFFIWTSVFNLFVVSIFWIVMVDVFSPERSKRLFGLIAAGGTLGAMSGSGLTALLSHLGPAVLLLCSAVLLEVAVFSAGKLERVSAKLSASPSVEEAERPLKGSVLSGLRNALGSPYLLGVTFYILLFTLTSTSLYFQQAEIVRSHFSNAAARTALFAKIDLSVNALTLVFQLLLTGRMVQWLGVGATLALLPLASAVGFSALAAAPTVPVLVAFQIFRRAGNFAIAKPARELLFTVLSREDKYRAKSFMDTVVYRAGDQLGAWSQAAAGALGAGPTAMALLAVPLSVAWLVNGIWLGREQQALQRGLDEADKQMFEANRMS